MRRIAESAAALLLASVLSLSAEIVEELTSAQLAEVRSGKQLVLMEEVEGHPWPRIRIFQKVNATPEEVAAVFFDYRNAKSYVPKLLKSDISKTISPCVLEVDYGVDVPIIPDEFYTARNTLSEADGRYMVRWQLVRALQTKSSEGNLRVEKFEGGSLLCYTNLVTPGSKMAGLLRMPAIEQMKNTVLAIVRQVESQKTNRPADLERQVAEMREALRTEPGR